jgi:hypothetical protein
MPLDRWIRLIARSFVTISVGLNLLFEKLEAAGSRA